MCLCRHPKIRVRTKQSFLIFFKVHLFYPRQLKNAVIQTIIAALCHAYHIYIIFTESTILWVCYYVTLKNILKHLKYCFLYIHQRGDFHTENMHSVLHIDVSTPFHPSTTCCVCTMLKFNSNMPKHFIPW